MIIIEPQCLWEQLSQHASCRSYCMGRAGWTISNFANVGKDETALAEKEQAYGTFKMADSPGR